MNKRILLIIVIGVLLIGPLVYLVLAKRAEVNSLNENLKNKDAKLSQLEKQVEGLSAEKSSLEGTRLSLEAKLANLGQDINNARDKEISLNKKVEAFAQEKKKLEDDLALTTQLMQDKLQSLKEESNKELTSKTKQYQVQESKFTSQIEDLNNKLKNLSEEKIKLEKNVTAAAKLTAQLKLDKKKLDHYRLGLAYENKQKYEAAVKEYEEILKIDPQNADIYRRLSTIYIYSIKDHERADFYSKGYTALINQKKSSAKRDLYNPSASVVDEKITPPLKTNEAEQTPGQKNKQRHIQNDSSSQVLGFYEDKALKHHYNLAIIYENEEKYKEAAQEYEKTLEFAPDDADIHYNLGIVYDEHLQDDEKAILHYRRYLELIPNADDADEVRKWIDQAKEDLDWQWKMR